MQDMKQSSLSLLNLRLRKSLTALVWLTGLAIALEMVTAAPNQPINPPCAKFSGTFFFTVFQFDSATTAHAKGDIWSGGAVVAHFSAQYFNIEQTGNGVIHANGQHTQTFLNGSTLVTHDEILLQSDNQDPAWVQANSRLHIVEGTGDFAGATGLLHTHGALNIVTLEGAIDFKGQLCIP
jgi:hypothetical protein